MAIKFLARRLEIVMHKSENMTRIINRKEFASEVIESTKLTLVQFTSEWNGACQIMAPIYEDLAKYYTSIANFFTINIEDNKLLETELGIIDVPTILLYKTGELIDHQVGLAPKNILISKIENALALNKN
jgi:thioredoxin 1